MDQFSIKQKWWDSSHAQMELFCVNATPRAWPILWKKLQLLMGHQGHSYPMELGQHVRMTTDWTMNHYEKLKNHSGWSLEP